MNHNVGIIILNWNSYDLTHSCLLSLEKLHIEELNTTIYVVDNGSTDDSCERLSKNHPEAIIINNHKNVGFTGGNNIGIRRAFEDGCLYFWILNNDTIVHPDSLKELIAAFKRPKTGISVSKIYFSRGREYHQNRYKVSEKGRVVWYAGGVIDWKNMYGTHRGVDEVDQGQYDEAIETDYATGCSFITNRAVIEKVGVFDERYFAYYEDMDFSLRVKKHGFKIWYAPKSIVWHINAGSTSRPGNAFQQYYQIRNRFLIGITYAPIRTKIALMKEGIRILFSDSKPKRLGILDAFIGLYGKRYQWTK